MNKQVMGDGIVGKVFDVFDSVVEKGWFVCFFEFLVDSVYFKVMFYCLLQILVSQGMLVYNDK